MGGNEQVCASPGEGPASEDHSCTVSRQIEAGPSPAPGIRGGLNREQNPFLRVGERNGKLEDSIQAGGRRDLSSSSAQNKRVQLEPRRLQLCPFHWEQPLPSPLVSLPVKGRPDPPPDGSLPPPGFDASRFFHLWALTTTCPHDFFCSFDSPPDSG